ncbi:MAG: cell wall metabolism sensor histidine kinase WalK [Candidatus Omnitrophica bacterium]|nr:cell wall metabolism sensor histidine kinase WalK [Candidatus Omnitrophota bacterium]
MRISIHYKITFIFVIITAVILSGVYFYLNSNLKKFTYQRIKTNLAKQIALSRTYLELESSKNITTYDLDVAADDIGKDLGLRATIIGFDGVVYGDSELEGDSLLKVENHLYRPEVQQAIKSGSGESRRFSNTVKKDLLYITSVYGQGSKQGIIRLSIPLSEIGQISDRLRQTLILSLLLAFILAVLVSFLASNFISNPIREISLKAKDISRGHFSQKIICRLNDEISDLAEAINNMSEKVKARIEEVNYSKSRLEAVFLSMLEGVMVVDIKGKILLMNQALKDYLKIDEDPLGKKPLEAIRNIEIQGIVDIVLNSNQELISREISVLLPEERVFLVHAAAIGKDKNSEGAVLVFHDVSNLRKLERLRQDFVANVSHELRTPVSTLKGYAETLLQGALEDKKNARDFLEIILSDSNRLASLIDDLLDLSKIESGKLILDKNSYKLSEIVKKVLVNLKIKDRSLKVSIDIPDDLPKVAVDEARIKQVLFNLIDNAVKYNRPQGQITISAEDAGEAVRVNISDTGIGIPQKDLPRIFERFYRVDKARSRELGGTGLGLSIVKHIIQAHNGEVFVQSIEGQGSTFSFILPKA